MAQLLEDIVDLGEYPVEDTAFRDKCRRKLDASGALVLRNFLKSEAIETIRREGEKNRHRAYYTTDKHNIYLSPENLGFPDDHPRNRQVSSSKGCITDDQIPADSALRTLYDSRAFRDFLCAVLGEASLHEYADPLSSINLHYAGENQELGWHFDNLSFAITLMIQPADHGGQFEFVRDVRSGDCGKIILHWND